MPEFRGRSTAACYHCHRQKVRCSGEQPCQRCRLRHKDCYYSTQDPIVPVPESYLQRLDRTLQELMEVVRSHGLDSRPGHGHARNAMHSSDRGQNTLLELPDPRVDATSHDSLVEDSTAESFIRKMKEVLHPGAHVNPAASPTSPTGFNSSQETEGSDSAQRRHAVMKFDSFHSQIVFRLPPYSYAVQLIGLAEQEFGDYHTFLRKSFWNRLHATYRDLSSQSSDRTWLCRLSLVLALAEANTTSSRPLSIALDGDGAQVPPQNDTSAPGDIYPRLSSGVEFFEQGLVLLKISYEEPTVDDVEALNLASHCCYILNRRKSAYAYAGQSIRLAHSLGLDRPAPLSLRAIEREHRKRVWWTAFCIDRATSTELGLKPAYVGTADGLDYPDSSGLTSEEREEFYDPDLLTAQVKICQLKSAVVDTVSLLKSKDIDRPYEILGQCLERLNACRSELTPSIFTGVGSAQQMASMPESRILSSISLRYHQCYILLLRPILLHQLAHILRNDSIITLSEEIRAVNNICLQAAQSNAITLINLFRSGKLVIFGYWDSVHLFSSLMILSLASLMISKQPAAFQTTDEPASVNFDVYKQARDILVAMVQAGNVSSKHHCSMLEEVEAIGSMLVRTEDGPPNANAWPEEGTGNPEIELGFDDWAELMTFSDTNFGSFDLFSQPLV